MASKFKKSVDDLLNSLSAVSDEIHDLAVFSLKQAKKGDMRYANLVVNVVNEDQVFKPHLIIEWFEAFGKVKWSNKKKRLLFADCGTWRIHEATTTLWGTGNKGIQSTRGLPPLTEANFKDYIQQYLDAHPKDESRIGKFGVPADKNRWGRYRLREKRK